MWCFECVGLPGGTGRVGRAQHTSAQSFERRLSPAGANGVPAAAPAHPQSDQAHDLHIAEVQWALPHERQLPWPEGLEASLTWQVQAYAGALSRSG